MLPRGFWVVFWLAACSLNKRTPDKMKLAIHAVLRRRAGLHPLLDKHTCVAARFLCLT